MKRELPSPKRLPPPPTPDELSSVPGTTLQEHSATAESLRREGMHCEAAAPYPDLTIRGPLQAERLADVPQGENETWVGTQRASRAASGSTDRAGGTPS